MLDDHNTLIEYFILDDHTLAWVIDRDGLELISLEITRDNLRNQVEFLHNLIVRRDFDLETAANLHADLIAPLVPRIRHPNLIIVRHSVLHYLPFAALWDAESERFLVQDYALTYAPSASALSFILDKRNPEEERLLVIGNPDGSLPHADTEVEAIASIYGSTSLIDPESQVHAQANRLDILHLSALGFYNIYNPLYTYIKLTPDGTNDGYLEVHEVFGMDLTEESAGTVGVGVAGGGPVGVAGRRGGETADLPGVDERDAGPRCASLSEMWLWKIWHPKHGVLYNAGERWRAEAEAEHERRTLIPFGRGRAGDAGGSGHVQIPLFATPP